MLETGFYNMDCMEGMKQFPDKFFELAIVDPPYGMHEKLLTSDKNLNSSNKFALMYQKKNWDKERPNKRYFDELFRVSENQIIWGGNYFTNNISISSGWIVWDKMGDNLTVVNNELAWSSFNCAVKMFRRCHGLDKGFMNKEGINIHPTQKPIALYKWLLTNYAHKCDKILDTHVGSASSLIACHQLGFQYWGFELDADYYKAASERLAKAKAQVSMFDVNNTETIEQVTI